MAAAMSLSRVYGGKGKSALLFHKQSVHIGTQQDHRASVAGHGNKARAYVRDLVSHAF